MKPLRVLVACEFSGIVRDAFAAQGCNAWSCDLLMTERRGQHFLLDVRDVLERVMEPWDLMIAFPPCTHLSVSGARWFNEKREQQEESVDCFMQLVNAPIPRICVENPIGIMSTRYRKPDQIIQPWQFGHGETKATCLWLKGLPKLVPTDIVSGREGRVWKTPPSPDRWKTRSRTLLGIAKAMASQWGQQTTIDEEEEYHTACATG